MDKGLELAIAQHFQVVSYMDMESPRDSRDRCPGIILMVHHLKPWGALQQDGVGGQDKQRRMQGGDK
uniref:Uncharacterized protein n=1 Tax=Oryza barthii TaxID=65489 RepID=A0A0D3G1D8_9ORYZ